MSKNRRSFTPEYKDEAAKTMVELSRSVASVAREFGFKEQTLRNWVNVYRRARAGEEPPLNAGAGGTTATGANNQIIFSVEANGQVITSVPAKPDKAQALDADLSTATGASAIRIVVSSSGRQDANVTPVWQGLRLEPTIGQ